MDASNLMELYSYLDTMYSASHPTPLDLFIVIPKATIQELPKIAQARKRGVKLTPTESPKLHEITISLRNRHVSGWLITSQPYWLFLMRALESPREVRRISETWISGMFPALSFGRVSSEHLTDVVESLERLDNSEVGVLSYILRREGEKPLYRNTSQYWEGYSAFDKNGTVAFAHSANKVVDAIHFTLRIDGRRIFETTLSRSGHLIFYGGNTSGFSEFVRVAVSRMANFALDELKNFRGLESRSETNYEVNTLSYEYSDDETFDKDIENLKRALIRNSAYIISLEHSRNPWFSLNAIDRGDGSTYDLHIFAHKLVVVFLTRAEPESISRLTSIIDSVFPRANRGAPKLA